MPIIAPMLLIMVLAVSVVILAVGLAIQRTNDLALEHERELVSRAILDHGDRLLRRVSTIAIADGWANSVAPAVNQLWLYEHLGTRLSSSLESDFTLVVDPQDRIVFGLESLMVLSQQMLESERAGFNSVIDELRHRLVHDTDAGRALGPTAAEFAASKGRTVRIGSFKGHAAIVAAATVSPGSRDTALPKAPAPILITINLIDQTFVARIGEKLKLTDIRAEGDRVPDPGQQTLPLVGLGNNVVEHLVWTPQRVSTDIWTYAAVILAVALGGLLALACFSMFYIRRASERLRSGEDQLRHLAHHDSLSGLPNRMFFSAKLDEVIATVNRDDGKAAVFCVDLDHFKDVNDTLGHHIGDELIRAVTNRLQRIFPGDAIVGRLGGDEFAVITTGAIGHDQIMAQANQIIGFLCSPYTLKGNMIVIGASIGIAVIERDLGTSGDFMRYADLALYRAKNDGRNRACIYDTEMVADLKRRKEMEYDLRAAIESEQLSVAYQPIVSPDGETIRGVEALCRWKHASRGDVSPSDFIPIAEESGLINALGEWILKSACMEAAAWPDMLLSVNVSSLQFRRPDFVEMVQSVLAQTKFDPNRLELELTESMLIGNVDAAESAMRHLKALGIKLALDDFGTGYSSLHYLRRFPFDKLKIDGSFVRNIESGADSAAIVHAVVSLGRGLGMKVTAEGVETAEQHLFLRAAGVHFLQGFLFSRPVSGETITKRLLPQNRKTA